MGSGAAGAGAAAGSPPPHAAASSANTATDNKEIRTLFPRILMGRAPPWTSGSVTLRERFSSGGRATKQRSSQPCTGDRVCINRASPCAHSEAMQAILGTLAGGPHVVNLALFSQDFWYRGSRMSHEQTTSTEDHRNVEGMRSELLSNSPAVGDRPPDRQTLGGPRAAALGLRALAGGAAPVYSSQTAEAGAVGRGGRPGTGVARSDGLLSGEAGGVGPGSGAGGLGVDHSSVSATRGLGPPQYEATAPALPERPSHATP